MTDLPALIDTNILVYFFEESDVRKNRIARKLIDSSWDGSIRWTVSIQSLTEFFLIVTKKLKTPVPEKVALQFISDICSHSSWIVIEVESSTLKYAVELTSLYTLSFLDAQIAASMLENTILTIYTEDSDFTKVKGLKVINPFN